MTDRSYDKHMIQSCWYSVTMQIESVLIKALSHTTKKEVTGFSDFFQFMAESLFQH